MTGYWEEESEYTPKYVATPDGPPKKKKKVTGKNNSFDQIRKERITGVAR